LQEACNESLDAFQKLLQTHSGRLSALLIEPAIGSRGYYFAPADYYQRLVALGREHGLVIISDEIQMGLGRLGGMIASHLQAWCPDLLVLGKALGGGMMPVSCVIGSSEIMDQLRSGYESETFAGSPLACRIAIETLRILSSTRVIEESRSLHDELRLGLASALPRSSVAGLGSATVIDLADAVMHQPTRGTQSADCSATGMGTIAAYKIAGQLRENGILVHVTGSQRDRIAIIPPLNICPAEMSRVTAEFVNAWRNFAQGE
jgi:acetylornithine/succinyldiaminopimelate/putrescine aminotransferase